MLNFRESNMRTRFAVMVSLFVLAACGPSTPGDEPPDEPARASFDDPEVERVWDRMMSVISPDDGWQRARYLEFDWAVNRGQGEPSVRRHRWDRWEGIARVESSGANGTSIAIFPTADPTSGRVWVGGTELTGEEAASALNSALRSHINDGYWLLMPFKWTDPGVNTRYAGEEIDDDGRRWEVVELTFEGGTGLTPQNMYRAFVNPETGRMERWHFLSNPDANPSPSDWTDWRRVGPIELSENRRSGGEVRIFFPHLRVETEVPAGIFDPPA
jgi:hypothetical protein